MIANLVNDPSLPSQGLSITPEDAQKRAYFSSADSQLNDNSKRGLSDLEDNRKRQRYDVG